MNQNISSFEKQLDLGMFTKESQEIVKDYICSLCQGILKDPVMDQCSHVFCRKCIENYLEVKKTCPSNNNYILDKNKMNSIKFVSQILERQTIHCLNKEKGCDWVNKLENLDQHLQFVCKKQPVKCLNIGCDGKILKENLENHLKNCDFRTIECPDCSINIPYILQSNHTNECTKYKINCPGGCGELIQRQNVDKHLKQECNNGDVECQYKSYGCNSIIRRKDINEHYKNNSPNHNILVLKFLENFQIANGERVKKIENYILDLTEKINKLDNKVISIENEVCLNRKKKRLTKNSEEEVKFESENINSQKENDYLVLDDNPNDTKSESNDLIELETTQISRIFDTTNISPDLVIEGNKITCRSMVNHKHHFAFFNKKLHENFEWMVKIIKCNQWISIGLCDKDQVVSNNYKFIGSKNHGCFLLTSNSYIWNCKNISENNKHLKSFSSFKDNDTISLEYEYSSKTLTFTNNLETVKLTNVKADNLVPCIIMLSNEDQVYILS